MEHKKELNKIKNLHLYANIQKCRVSSKLENVYLILVQMCWNTSVLYQTL